MVGTEEKVSLNMEEEGTKAAQELTDNFGKYSAEDVALWFERWYLRAGHKRLGRTLVQFARAINAAKVEKSVQEVSA